MKPSASCTASNEADITTSVDTQLLPESSDQQQYFDSPDNQEATHQNVLPSELVNDLSHTPTVDVLLDDCESSAQPSVTEDMNTPQRPQRTRKTPTQFAYTTPGEPVDCQLNQIATVPNFPPIIINHFYHHRFDSTCHSCYLQLHLGSNSVTSNDAIFPTC